MLTEEEISMVLNTYMYMNYKEAEDGMTLREILEEVQKLPEYQEGGRYYGEYSVVSKAAGDDRVGEMVIGSQSHLMGFDDGTCACTFSSKENDEVYVVYRGTGDGEWPDNGLGMTREKTLQQERALTYFETVVEKEGYQEGDRVIITGHSKGGNKAQYVTMTTSYDGVVSACYNIDGQGFSEKAIAGWKRSYSDHEYEARRSKITGIYGENDYIHVLGRSIVREDQTYYVKTPVAVENFAGYHDIKFMFAAPGKEQGEKTSMIFSGSKNSYVAEPGLLLACAAALSAEVMKMPEEKRDGAAAVLMQLMELSGKKKRGQNGEILTKKDVKDFYGAGIPVILKSLLLTEEGRSVFFRLFQGRNLEAEMEGRQFVQIEKGGFDRALMVSEELLAGLSDCFERLERIQKQIPFWFRLGSAVDNRIVMQMNFLDGKKRELMKMKEKLQEIRGIYDRMDKQMEEEMAL